ncbi:hypothetical protein ACFPRL_16100 [Pseudoclavibacter helvolus]
MPWPTRTTGARYRTPTRAGPPHREAPTRVRSWLLTARISVAESCEPGNSRGTGVPGRSQR